LKQEIGWPEGGIAALYDTQVILGVLSYYLLSLLLYVFLPGHEVEGTELACGGRHKYKFNGMGSSNCGWWTISDAIQRSSRPF